MRGIVSMEPEIVCVPSAFKHGFSEADIRRVIRTRIRNVLINGYEDKYAIIGFDTKGNALEIMYDLLSDQTMEVFRASAPLRPREVFFVFLHTFRAKLFGIIQIVELPP